MLNKFIVQGRIVNDVVPKMTANGIPVATFSIACDRDFKDESGNREADFFNIIAWRKLAEFVEKYFHKGDQIIVSGRMQVRKYKTQDGSTRQVTECIADDVYFGEKKKDGDQRSSDDVKGQKMDDFMELPDDDMEGIPFK